MNWIKLKDKKPETKEIAENEFYKSEIVLCWLGAADGYELLSYQHGNDGSYEWESFYNYDLDSTVDVAEIIAWCYIDTPKETNQCNT